MRLRTRLTLAVVTAAVAVAVALATGPIPEAIAARDVAPLPLDSRRPTCLPADTEDFPVRTRIYGGPADYDAGGDHHTWFLDITNTTSRTCRGIHPVIVLVDEKRALRPAQPRLDFYTGGHSHPVTFERTDADELVGVLDHEGFSGFTVPPGRTLTVRLRLAVASGSVVPNDVVANAAVVQRRGNDGDWVGESNEYRFRILDRHVPGDAGRQEGGEEGGTGGGGDREDPGAGGTGGTGEAPGTGGTGEDPGTGGTGGTGEDPGTGGTGGTGEDFGTGGTGGTGEDPGTGTGTEPRTDADVREEGLPWVDELARTGASVSAYIIGAIGAIAVSLLAAGAVLVALARRKSR